MTKRSSAKLKPQMTRTQVLFSPSPRQLCRPRSEGRGLGFEVDALSSAYVFLPEKGCGVGSIQPADRSVASLSQR